MGIIKRESKEKKPKYVHQEYPKHVYLRTADGSIVSKVVKTKEEHEAIKPGGWCESPTECSAPEPGEEMAQVPQAQLESLLQELEELRALKAASEEPEAAPASKAKGKGK